MKFALVNPDWTFDGSIYFGCREPHLPIEYGYAKALLEAEGHEALLVDAHLERLPPEEVKRRIAGFRPDFTVITTAPSYLFWRCAPPELRVPRKTAGDLRGRCGALVVVGPHASTTPHAALRKTGADIAVRGEFEEILPELARKSNPGRRKFPAVCLADDPERCGTPHTAGLETLPPLHWPLELIRRHSHHHHRFDAAPDSPGAEMETSRGCPYRCVFCAKESFRGPYRRRPLSIVLEELDRLIGQGVGYIYFIDEIFMPDEVLLKELRIRRFKFGVQLRIDLWNPEMLALLGSAGCVSIEAGVESVSEKGREGISKKSGIPFAEITERLIFAKRHIRFVQANLIDALSDDPAEVAAWRGKLLEKGVWANKPVPLFAYPGSPLYRRRWGNPDDGAWERAHADYLKTYARLSDIQDVNPLPLAELESRG